MRPGGLGASPQEAPRGAEGPRAAARGRPRRCLGDGPAASGESSDEAPARPERGRLPARGRAKRGARPGRRDAAGPPRPGPPGPRGEGELRPGGAAGLSCAGCGPGPDPARGLPRGLRRSAAGPPAPLWARPRRRALCERGNARRRSAGPRRRGEPGSGVGTGGRLCGRHGRLRAPAVQVLRGAWGRFLFSSTRLKGRRPSVLSLFCSYLS